MLLKRRRCSLLGRLVHQWVQLLNYFGEDLILLARLLCDCARCPDIKVNKPTTGHAYHDHVRASAVRGTTTVRDLIDRTSQRWCDSRYLYLFMELWLWTIPYLRRQQKMDKKSTPSNLPTLLFISAKCKTVVCVCVLLHILYYFILLYFTLCYLNF